MKYHNPELPYLPATSVPWPRPKNQSRGKSHGLWVCQICLERDGKIWRGRGTEIVTHKEMHYKEERGMKLKHA